MSDLGIESHPALDDDSELVKHINVIEIIDNAIEILNPRQQFVIRQYFFYGKTLAQIAAEIGVSTQRVRQIKERSLLDIRRSKVISIDAADMLGIELKTIFFYYGPKPWDDEKWMKKSCAEKLKALFSAPRTGSPPGSATSPRPSSRT